MRAGLWGWSTEYRCREEERERDKTESGERLKGRERGKERERDMEGGLWENLLYNVGK